MSASSYRETVRTATRFASALVLFTGAFMMAAAAKAEILSISGAAFIQQCPCAASGNLPDVNKGVLVPTDQSNLYAAVDFPTNGQEICRFSLIYQDTNNNDALTARLSRKAFAVGGPVFNNPTTIATAKSAAGVVATVRRATAPAISNPTIDDTTGFYFVEVSAPTVNLALIGVQIDYRPTCP